MTLTFLHTSHSQINKFNTIVSQIDKSVNLEHAVNEDILKNAMETGELDKAGFNIEVQQLKKSGATSIICTCSTYGDLCYEEEHVFCIDKPIAQYTANTYKRIGIAYTVNTSLKSSRNLILNYAKEIGKTIQLNAINCSNCWTWFEKGDIKRYELEIAKHIKNQTNNLDVVYLSQASMEGAIKYVNKDHYQVLSSPRYGVTKYIELLKKKSKFNDT